MQRLKLYLLKCAKVHGVKNVLCIIWMLLKRDRFLEGFGLQNKEDRNRSTVRKTYRATFPCSTHEHATTMLLKAAFKKEKKKEENQIGEIMAGSC